MDDHTRVTLLEDEVDAFEVAMVEQNRTLSSIRALLMTAIATFATSAVLLALNMAVEGQ